MAVKGDKDDNDLVIHLNKDQPHTEIRVSDEEHGKDSSNNKQEHKDDTRGEENEAKRSKGSLNPNLTRNKTNLLPNKVESWDYYKFRNGKNYLMRIHCLGILIDADIHKFILIFSIKLHTI